MTTTRERTTLRDRIARSARPWNLSPKAASWIFWIPLVGAVLMILARVDKGLYRFLLADDGLVEWAQFACFLAGSIAAFAIATLRTKTHAVQGILYAILGFGLFFIAGEEIAWGQRILGLTTPDSLKQINTQDEITLHNIENVLGVLNVVMMLVGLFGALAIWLNRFVKIERYGEDAEYLFVPPLFLAPSFLVLFAYKFVRLTILTVPGFTITKYGEWSEFCLAFAMCLFVGLNYRRLTHRPAPVTRKNELEDTFALASHDEEAGLRTKASN